jgi:carbonic anhydrase/acetyltransferase-like protein (isoleucine patch superfamily)
MVINSDKQLEKKYEFTGETVEFKGRTLYRIRRITDGLVGGYIRKESNLSHEGSCFVYDNAKVYEDAEVSENAIVSGNADISGYAKLRGNCHVTDNAELDSHATVEQNAIIGGNAKLTFCARITGNRKIFYGYIESGMPYVNFLPHNRKTPEISTLYAPQYYEYTREQQRRIKRAEEAEDRASDLWYQSYLAAHSESNW